MYLLYLSDRYDTLELQSNGIEVLDYPMRGPAPDSERPPSEIAATPPDFDDVVETLRLMLAFPSQHQVVERIRRLERFLERARHNSRRRPSDAVYLYIKLDSDVWLWRSEILLGELSEENPLDQLWKLKTAVSITFTRRYYWEMADPNPLEVSLSANGQSGGFGGRNITLTAGQNWVQIATQQVGGSLPTPLHFELLNNSGGTQFVSTIWAINNAHSDPVTVNTGFTAGEMVGGRWLLPSALMNAVKGKYVRAILHHTGGGVSGLASGRLEVDLTGSDPRTVWSGEAVTAEVATDLGVFPIPPGGKTDGFGNVYFRATTPWTIHHLQLIPVSSERRLSVILTDTSFGLGLGNGHAVVDDGILDETYALIGDKVPMVVGHGDPLWVWPGMVQRIYFASNPYLSGGTPHVFRVKAWMRPRRGTV